MTASPNPALAAVAAIIAKGRPHEWMVPELVRRSPLVGYRRNYIKDDDTDDKSAIVAARNLEEQLRIHVLAAELIAPGDYDQLPLPDCIETVLRDLPEVIEYLESQLLPSRKGGPTPDRRRRLCAFVCADLWRRQHGEVQPRSHRLWEACEAYWQACGHPGTSAYSATIWMRTARQSG